MMFVEETPVVAEKAFTGATMPRALQAAADWLQRNQAGTRLQAIAVAYQGDFPSYARVTLFVEYI